MEKVLNQAELLAESILESEEYIRMRLSEQAATHDEGAAKLVAAYTEKRTEVENILASADMDHEVLAKAGLELDAIEKQIDEYPLLKDMRSARADFTDMMNKVNQIIRFVVTGESGEEEEGGCTGSCESCGGHCHH